MSVMPVDHGPALASHEAATPARGAVSRSVSGPACAHPTAAVAREFRALSEFSGSTALVVAAVAAAASTVLAIQLDAPDPVALVAGYATLAATAGICAARITARYSAPATQAVGPAAEPRSSAESHEREPVPGSGPKTPLLFAANEANGQATDNTEPVFPIALSTGAPNAARATHDDGERVSGGQRRERKAASRPSGVDDAAWKRVDRLRVADAARLWCGLTPGHHASADVMTRASAILDAIERGELPKSENAGILAQYRNGWHTEIDRNALKAWAASNGHVPRFLQE